MAELVLSKVDKIYRSRKGDVHAVKALDLTVKPGEIVALLGSSGCGKTSTLRMIAGFEDVTERLDHARRQAASTRCRPRARRRHGLRGLLALSAADGAARTSPSRSRPRSCRRPSRTRASRRCARMLEIDRHPQPLSLLGLRRPAAARQPRPRAGARCRALSPRRADGPARAAAARRAARPHQALPARAQVHDHPRHPRPDGGQCAGRPHRGDGRWRAAAVCNTGRAEGSAPPTSSPAPSSASRR